MTVQVLVDWGDGTVETLPAAGTSQSWSLSKSHTYVPGSYTVQVTDSTGSTDSVPVTVAATPPPTPRAWTSGASGEGDLGTYRGSPLEIRSTWMNDPACYPLVPPDDGCPECGELADWTGPIDAGLSPPDFTTWAAEAGGFHDAFWTSFAANLSTFRDARPTWVRPYYEFNGDWMPWSVVPGQEANFRTAFARTAAILRAGYPSIKIMLGTAASQRDVSIANCWPATVVDALSIDFYNTYPWVNTLTAFTDKITTAEGDASLEKQRQLAQSKGVPVVISEWASASVDTGGGAGGGDAPVFFTAMHEWLTSHAGTGAGQVRAEVYFNVDEGYDNNYFLLDSAGVVNPAQPNAAAAYRSLW